ncbi:hypothetical protein [Sporichthya polymorpha]|uniref:hypothetical protein n=1 Tax=Sporichthya polymorpha TaxID=35751 RepID=UPI0003634559|nr:hypothetical protein [Sporichthya polymorpha]
MPVLPSVRGSELDPIRSQLVQLDRWENEGGRVVESIIRYVPNPRDRQLAESRPDLTRV